MTDKYVASPLSMKIHNYLRKIRRALRGSVGRDAYTAAKGGVVSLTRSLAVKYAKHHIRVNALAPGPTLTERVKKFVAGTDEKHLLGMGEPEDVAQAALLLASDESRRITGTIVPVDSGWSAGIANAALEGN